MEGGFIIQKTCNTVYVWRITDLRTVQQSDKMSACTVSCVHAHTEVVQWEMVATLAHDSIGASSTAGM